MKVCLGHVQAAARDIPVRNLKPSTRDFARKMRMCVTSVAHTSQVKTRRLAGPCFCWASPDIGDHLNETRRWFQDELVLKRTSYLFHTKCLQRSRGVDTFQESHKMRHCTLEHRKDCHVCEKTSQYSSHGTTPSNPLLCTRRHPSHSEWKSTRMQWEYNFARCH